MPKSILKKIRKTLSLLPRKGHKRILILTLLQCTLSLLDLLGVALIGFLGALAVAGVQSREPGQQVSGLLNLTHISNIPFQAQVAVIAFFAAAILVMRTLLSIIVTKKILKYLSQSAAAESSALFTYLLSQGKNEIRTQSHYKLAYSLTTGVNALYLGVLGSAITIFADASILILIISSLFFLDLMVAISAIVLFGSMGYLLHHFQSSTAAKLGLDNTVLTVSSEDLVLDTFNTYRELTVHNQMADYLDKFSIERVKLARVQAEIGFMPQVSKYAIESSMVIGTLVISGIQFVRQDATHAVAILAVFLAAGSRIAPALMRLQQNLVTLNNSYGISLETQDLLSKSNQNKFVKANVELVHESKFTPKIEVNNLSFSFENMDGNQFLLDIPTLTINEGEFVAIVGPSGSGKSTLVDLILGILEPASGSIQISEVSPQTAFATWPGAISYVPQDVHMIKGDLIHNVTLGGFLNVRHDVEKAIEMAGLGEIHMDRHRHVNIAKSVSGGQRQRIGIARAIYTDPRLLVLDEATSSLDAQTENFISDRLDTLRGRLTMVVIAHRLSTIKSANRVIYLENGVIAAQGTFDEVRKQIPNFNEQARLMGIGDTDD